MTLLIDGVIEPKTYRVKSRSKSARLEGGKEAETKESAGRMNFRGRERPLFLKHFGQN